MVKSSSIFSLASSTIKLGQIYRTFFPAKDEKVPHVVGIFSFTQQSSFFLNELMFPISLKV